MCMVAVDSLVPGTLVHSLVSTISQFKTVNTVDLTTDVVTVNVDWYLTFDQLMEVQHILNPASEWNDNIRVSRDINNKGFDVRINLSA